MARQLEGTPSIRLLSWLDRLSPELRAELAELVVGGMAHLDSTSDDTLGVLRLHLDSGMGKCPTDAMNVAAIAGVIDVVFFGRSTRADWERARTTQERLATVAERDGDVRLATFVRQGLTSLDDRAQAWMDAARSWNQLRSGSLAASAIGRWLLDFYDDRLAPTGA